MVGANEDERVVTGVDQVGLIGFWCDKSAIGCDLNEGEQASGSLRPKCLRHLKLRGRFISVMGDSIAIMLVLLLTERRRSYLLPLILLLLSPLLRKRSSVSEMPILLLDAHLWTALSTHTHG